jgi:thioredoxin 1
MSAGIVEVSTDNFDSEVKKSSTPVLVDFWAPWCGPCKAIAPLLEELAKGAGGKYKVAKVNIDDNQALAGQYNIRAIPTMLLFKGGEIKETIVGASVSKKDLEQKLASLT